MSLSTHLLTAVLTLAVFGKANAKPSTTAACSGYSREGLLATVSVTGKGVEFAASQQPDNQFSLTMASKLTTDICTVSFSADSQLAAITLYDTAHPARFAHLLVADVRQRQWVSASPIALDVQIPPPVVVSGFFSDSHQLLVSAAHPFVRDGNATIFPELVEVSPDREHVVVSSDVRSVPAPIFPIIYLDPANNRLWHGVNGECSLRSETLFGDMQGGTAINPPAGAPWCGTQPQVLFPDPNSVVFASQQGNSISLTRIKPSGGATETISLKPAHGVAYWLFPGTLSSPDGGSIAFNVREIRHGALGSEVFGGLFLAVLQTNPLKLVSMVSLPERESASIDSASLGPKLGTLTYYSGKHWKTQPVQPEKGD